ncbi:Holliday junction resolvase RecU [Lysinibacillus alkalisoli]|uniref:Holliday junction resolvase RecU n=1 Tax=Lysinibacillus alkalisoli TaxID=1911548 RepID=A0A917LJK8_9BACI|nr:Holliday junction resolvase RecU [Lysinibacillus alkalisoli]GGG31322.1 Holliday junction resolvase RecU [Lysinibacillus alkalisoli]
MTIRYPNGKPFIATPTSSKQVKNSFSNRGQSLEDDLNETNAFYLAHQQAVVHKKPVPIQIVNVEYPHRSAAVIREAYFRTPSTTDYNGVWQGHYIDFEAKETKNKTSFPLQNIHEHQMSHMAAVQNQGGCAFFIIRFTNLARDYFVPYSAIAPWWAGMKKGERKSIPLSFFETQICISNKYAPRIDYLQALRTFVNRTESEENNI